MRLDLYRKWKTEDATIGELHVNSAFFCFTLEDIARARGVKVKHQTAIPAGVYDVVMTWSNRFQKVMPRLLSVPMFEGILIHAGNTAADTSGCILVGKHRGDNQITESRSAFAELYNLIARAAVKGKVSITVHRLAGDDVQAAHTSTQPSATTRTVTNPASPVVTAQITPLPQAPVVTPSKPSTITIFRLLPFLASGSIGAPLIQALTQYKWPLITLGAGTLGFWLGWQFKRPHLEK